MEEFNPVAGVEIADAVTTNSSALRPFHSS
jgi:hypothetical protein